MWPRPREGAPWKSRKKAAVEEQGGGVEVAGADGQRLLSAVAKVQRRSAMAAAQGWVAPLEVARVRVGTQEVVRELAGQE
jgi:hypothetical protein